MDVGFAESSIICCAGVHGGVFTSPGIGQSASAVAANMIVKLIAIQNLLRFSMIFSPSNLQILFGFVPRGWVNRCGEFRGEAMIAARRT